MKISRTVVRDCFGEPSHVTSSSRTMYYFNFMIRAIRLKGKGDYVIQPLKEKDGKIVAYDYRGESWVKGNVADHISDKCLIYIADKILLEE